MLEIIGIVLAVIGLLFAFETPRKRFVGLFRNSGRPSRERRVAAAAAGLDETELKIVTILGESHWDVPRTKYLAHRLKTHEYNIRIAGENLAKKGIIYFIHYSPEDEYGLLLHKQGRRFLVEHKLLD